MKFTVIDCEQRSELWYAARAGRLTGSVAGDMLAKIKSGEAAARRNLRTKLIVERLTGKSQEDTYVSKEMQRGIDMEPMGIGAYEAETGLIVERTGFISCDDYLAGCSLDGHVNNFEGIVELKCPNSATHLKYIQGGCVPYDHLAQIRHNVWITGAKWADFVSFDDRFPEDLQLFRVRVHRKDLAIDDYAEDARLFLAEVSVDLVAVQELQKQRKAA